MSQNEDLVKLLTRILASKQNVTLGDSAVASPYLDGLLDKDEAAGMANGFVGAKGAVADGTSFDDVQQGGVYLMAAERNYKNSPFYLDNGDTPEMHLTVYRTYHTDPNTGNPLILQQVMNVEDSGKIKFAYRFMWNNTFYDWYYPQGVILWEGLQSIGSGSFELSQPLTNFSQVVIYWQPYLQASFLRREFLVFEGAEFSLNQINNPNTTTITPIAITSEEVTLTMSADAKTLTGKGSFYSAVDGGKVELNTDNVGKSMIRRIVGVPYF